MKKFKDTKKIIILSNKKWNANIAKELNINTKMKFILINKKDDFSLNKINEIGLEYIFVVHWSYKIPEEIWSRYRTIIFHMTDLPYGRGGSPLQNLIKEKKIKSTISAIKCAENFDSGDIYIKKEIILIGSAEEIFIRANEIIKKIIIEIISRKIIPLPQKGEVKVFKRRVPEESDLDLCKSNLNDWYDHIRMLDAEGYPFAFLDFNGMRLEFRRASLRSDGIHSDVRIFPKEEI